MSSSSSTIDQATGFGFNTDSNGNKNYFIKRGDVNYQVDLEQISFDIQERLGLRSPNAVRPDGGSSFSFDNNTGLIYSTSVNSYGSFSIFDPVSRYGFSGEQRSSPYKDYTYYFTQNDEGIQSKVASYFLPENVKTLLQTGIRENITQNFILPEDEIPTPRNPQPDPRCPSACYNCHCDPEKRKLSQKLYEDVQNNPDPKYPMGCSRPQVACSCPICTRIDFIPDIAPSFAPRPKGLTDPEGSSGIAPSFAPRPKGLTDPEGSSGFAPSLLNIKQEISTSFWNQYIILFVVVLVIIMIIFLFMSGGKNEEE